MPPAEVPWWLFHCGVHSQWKWFRVQGFGGGLYLVVQLNISNTKKLVVDFKKYNWPTGNGYGEENGRKNWRSWTVMHIVTMACFPETHLALGSFHCRALESTSGGHFCPLPSLQYLLPMGLASSFAEWMNNRTEFVHIPTEIHDRKGQKTCSDI